MCGFKGEFFGFKFSGMNLGLGVTALIFFVSFFVSRQKMKSLGGSSRSTIEIQIAFFITNIKNEKQNPILILILNLNLYLIPKRSRNHLPRTPWRFSYRRDKKILHT